MRKALKKGFTLIELSLSIVFISIILLTIAFLTLYVIGIYEKGVVVKDIAATGRELIDDFSRSISLSSSQSITSFCYAKYSTNAPARNACINDGAFKFVYQENYGVVTVRGVEKTVPISGIFCTGSFSYAWNTGYALNEEEFTHKSGATALTYGGKAPRLLKFMDSGRTLCANAVSSSSYTSQSFSVPVSAVPEELLDNNESSLVFYDFTVMHPTQHSLTSQSFYSATFTLGTSYGNIDITGSGDYCAQDPDTQYGDLFEYCAINRFNFSMRSTGQMVN